MNNYYQMAATLENRNRSQAYLITAGFTGLMILLMFLLKWELPRFEKTPAYTDIEVELNLPEEPETAINGGGGGGNPVQASGEKGVAPYTPPAPGEEKESKSLDDIADKESTPVSKPIVTSPKAKTLNNSSVAKTEPKPVVENPAPRTPKAVLGQTTTGSGRGGGADDFERSGGSGTGAGVGNGSGTGGGSGSGNGGGNGSGTGTGTGPRVTRGDRKIVRSYSFEDELDRATIYANVNVSPEGVGSFVSIAKGSSSTGNAYKQAIIRYLQNIRFDRSDHESMVTVQFNFRVN